MAVRIPRRTRIQTALTAVAMAGFGVLLLGIGAQSIRTAADVTLDCRAATGRCELEQVTHFGVERTTFAIAQMGPTTNRRVSKSSYALVVTPDGRDPGRTVGIGSVSWDEVQAQQQRLDDFRAGYPADVHLTDRSRWGNTLWPLLSMSIGVAAVLGAFAALWARRRAGHHHLPDGSDRATPGRTVGPAAVVSSVPERDLQDAQLQQHQLEPIAACVAPWLPEPAVAVGSFVPATEMRRAAGWPRWVVVAVTPTTMFVFAVAFDTHGFFQPNVTYRVQGALAQWPLVTLECAMHDPTFGTRSLLVQPPGWPLVELTDSAYRAGHLAANDLLYHVVPLVVPT